MQPTFRRLAAVLPHASHAPVRPPFLARMLFPMIALGSAAVVVNYVRMQLASESGEMNKIFAKQHDGRHEAARKKIYTDTEPRRSLYNILSW